MAMRAMLGLGLRILLHLLLPTAMASGPMAVAAVVAERDYLLFETSHNGRLLVLRRIL